MSRLSVRGIQSHVQRRRIATRWSAITTFFLVALVTACGSTTEPVKVATISVTPGTTTKNVGATQQYSATTLDANGNALANRSVTWSSSNTSVATINTSGVATAVSAGSATITATSGGQAGTATLTVNPPPVTSVTITPSTLSISEIATSQLTAITKGADGSTLANRTVTWSSSTPAAAAVSATGLVTAVAPGTTVITATSEGVSGTAAVTITVSPCNTSLAVPITAGQTLTGTLANTDCPLGDGTYLDVYKLVVAASTTVDIVMKSTAFDAYLFLYAVTAEGTLQDMAENDNGAGGTNAELSGLLPIGTYYILANSNNVAGFGAYTLSLVSPAPVGINFGTASSATVVAPSGRAIGGSIFRGLLRH